MASLKTIVKSALRRYGIDVRRARIDRYPFVKRVQVAGTAVDAWIATAEGECWYGGAMEQHELTELRRMVSAGDRLLEIGTHHGVHLQVLTDAVGIGGRVVGIEAAPEAAMIAQANVSLNGTGDRCRILWAVATATGEGTVPIRSVHNVQLSEATAGTVMAVPAVSGDGVDRANGPFNFLKVDVEGHELEVLMGCGAVLARHPRIALELHVALLREQGIDPARVLDLIDLDKYDVTYIARPQYTERKSYSPAALDSAPVLNLFMVPRLP